MKVKDLEIGMMVRPAGDCQVFWINQPYKYKKISVSNIPWASIRTKSYVKHRYQKTHPHLDPGIYLGTRKDVSISKEEQTFSNRYILLGGVVCAVDPAAWKQMEIVDNL